MLLDGLFDRRNSVKVSVNYSYFDSLLEMQHKFMEFNYSPTMQKFPLSHLQNVQDKYIAHSYIMQSLEQD